MNVIESETEFVNRMIAGFTPSIRRRTTPHEADAELVELFQGGSPGNGPLLAVTTDTISEEIETGLYTDHFQIGWMSVMANLSDLAAVGAEPLGLLLSETLPGSIDHMSLAALQKGISDACRLAGTHVIGGDTNFGASLSITGTAIGLVGGGGILTRKGCVPGDLLFTSGRLGRGNGFALSVFRNSRSLPLRGGYYPRARLREGALLRGSASSCMDTSDGFFSTLDQLGTINGVGFRIRENWEETLDGTSVELTRAHGFPPWLLLAGCHGEFELVFTISPSRRDTFCELAAAAGWKPIEIGTVTHRPGLLLPVGNGMRSFDLSAIRNLSYRQQGGIDTYLGNLMNYEQVMVKGEA